MAQLVQWSNNAVGALAAPITDTDVTITLAAGNGALFPALTGAEYFYGTLKDVSGNLEIVKVTARATDTLTVTRAQDGTTARAFTTGDVFALRITAAGLDALFAEAVATAEVATVAHAATSKATPVDADELPLVDSAASNTLKKLTWANLKAALWASWGALINAGTAKTTPVDGDAFALMDSAASNATKKLTWADIKATLFGTASAWTAAQTFRAANSVRAEAASTQDAVVLAGRAGGTSSYAVSLTPATLTGNRTATFADESGTVALIGVQQQIGHWPAAAIKPATTNGCASLAWDESSTNKVMTGYLAFDAAAIEYGQFAFRAPAALDESANFKAVFEWTEASGATSHDCMWQIEMQAQGDADTIDSAWGTAVTVTDTGTSGTRRLTAATAAITPGGTWAAGDEIIVRVSRKATDAADTLNVDAKLIGVALFATYAVSTEP